MLLASVALAAVVSAQTSFLYAIPTTDESALARLLGEWEGQMDTYKVHDVATVRSQWRIEQQARRYDRANVATTQEAPCHSLN